MRTVSEDTDPFVTAPCEGCPELVQKDGDVIGEIEDEYGVILCRSCQDDCDNGNTPHDEEAAKEAAWEWVNNR